MTTIPRLLAALALTVAPMVSLAQQITVSAATSLTQAFRDIGARFEAARPGVTVRLNFAASGVLLQQIAHGAPADLLASADPQTLDRGIAQQWLDAASRRDFAANTLVVVTPAGSPVALARAADLAAPAVRRIALGKPATVPAGRYARQVLEREALWPRVEPRLVFADNVRQVLDYVARGEVEAGFVFRTDALLMPDRVQIRFAATGHEPVTYPLAVVAGSRQAALARDFAAFVLGPEAQAILARHGFAQPAVRPSARP
jgi:molybdate transport system substrate-binding protein